MIKIVPMLLAALSLTGCSALSLRSLENAIETAGIARFQRSAPLGTHAPGRLVGVTDPQMVRVGHGAVISDRHVLTVAHLVCGPRAWVATSRASNRGWVSARVVARIGASPEPLVLLQLDLAKPGLASFLGFGGFTEEDCYRISPGSPPAFVALARGVVGWEEGSLRPGDSGSPVLDASGAMVGLLSGRRARRWVYAPLPSAPVGEPLIEQRPLSGSTLSFLFRNGAPAMPRDHALCERYEDDLPGDLPGLSPWEISAWIRKQLLLVPLRPRNS